MDAAVVASPVRCSNPECKVAETGRCVEGLELSVCPRFGKEPAPVSLAVSDQQSTIPGISLPGAMPLSLEEAPQVLALAESRVIAIIGPHDAGKTSLLAGIYDMFQVGPVGTMSFSRSWVLQGFEMVCHDARVESKRGIAHSPRTRRGQVVFYHLELRDQTTGNLTEILFADRAGEEYKEVSSDIETALQLPEIMRADTITLLVDGAQLSDLSQRHNAREGARMMVRALCNSGAVRPDQALAIVLTKLDAVAKSEKPDRAEADFANLVADVRDKFGSHFRTVVEHRVAASPKSDGADRGAGLPELLEQWLKFEKEALAEQRVAVNSSRLFAELNVVAVDD